MSICHVNVSTMSSEKKKIQIQIQTKEDIFFYRDTFIRNTEIQITGKKNRYTNTQILPWVMVIYSKNKKKSPIIQKFICILKVHS